MILCTQTAYLIGLNAERMILKSKNIAQKTTNDRLTNNE